VTPSPAERRRALGVDRWAVRDRRLSMAEALPFDGPNEVASWLRGQHAVRALRRGELTVMYPGGTPEVDAANWLAYHDGSPAWAPRPGTCTCSHNAIHHMTPAPGAGCDTPGCTCQAFELETS
jgi:hypothetical protein